MLDVVRAWKDPAYRFSLSDEEKKELPDNPAGESWNELEDEDLDSAAGGQQEMLDFPVTSGGHICTATTECPLGSLCC